MYGRMQFADFVVSWALQSLSRSLQQVAGQGENGSLPLRPCERKTLMLTAERVFSLWQMVQWSVARLEFKRAQADLQAIVKLCATDRVPEKLAAERLLDRASPKAARLLADIVAGLTPPSGQIQGRVREQLNELLQAESERWRSYAPLRQIEESVLVEHGMLRAFRKAETLSGRLERIAQGPEERPPSAKRLLRAGRWAHHTVNHLELIRPALSDAGRTRRWHLTRLAAKLDEQWALEKLSRATLLMDLKPKASVRLDRLIRQERARLDKQRRKLASGAFAGGVEAYRKEVTAAVAQLGLEAITLLPVDGAANGKPSEKEAG